MSYAGGNGGIGDEAMISAGIGVRAVQRRDDVLDDIGADGLSELCAAGEHVMIDPDEGRCLDCGTAVGWRAEL